MRSKSEALKTIVGIIVNVINTFSLNSQKAVDHKFKTQLANSIYLLTHIYTLLKFVADHPQQNKVTDEIFVSQTIMWQACNTMFAALQLTRQGYMLEPQFLMRQAIESFALAMSFHSSHKAYPLYKKGELSGEKCIGFAKKMLGEIGQIYGLLTSVTHPSRNTTGTAYNEESYSVIFGGGYTEKLSYRTLFDFAMLNYLLLTIWKGSELVFYKFETSPMLWEKSGSIYNLKLDDSIKSMVETVKKDFKQAISELDKK